jgi:hypothetical protein
MIFAGETEVLGENLPSATLSTTNPTWIDPGANPGLRGERPATDDLSHGTATADFYHPKNPSPLPGLNPRPLDPVASAPPKRQNECTRIMDDSGTHGRKILKWIVKIQECESGWDSCSWLLSIRQCTFAFYRSGHFLTV